MLLQSNAGHVVIFLAYGLVVLGGMLCNVLFVVSVAVSQEKKRSVTRMLIANLALSDIFMLSFAFFPPISAIQDNWPFGEYWCKTTQFVSALSIFVSSFSAMAIACHRYLRIVKLRRGKSHPVYAWSMIIATWIVSVCFSMPIFVKATVIEIRHFDALNSRNLTQWKCAEIWDNTTYDYLFTAACLIVQFVLPMCVIAVCYGQVSLVLRNRLRFHMSRAQHQDQQLLLLVVQRQRRTIQALVIIFSMYLLSWMPYNLFIITLVFNLHWMTHWPYVEAAYVAAHVLAISSGVHNPIIYSWMHSDFRKQARADLLRCCHACCRSNSRRALALTNGNVGVNGGKNAPVRCQLIASNDDVDVQLQLTATLTHSPIISTHLLSCNAKDSTALSAASDFNT